MQISKEEFSDILLQETELSFQSDLAKNIFLFYKEKKYQKEYYNIEFTGTMEYRTKLEYRKFGLDMGGLPPIATERYYLLLLSKSDLKALKRKAEDFVEQYLPHDAIPTHYIIDAKLSVEEQERYTAEIKSLYPDCVSFTNDIEYRQHLQEQERKNELSKKLEKFDKLDIEPFMQGLLDHIWPYTESFIKELHSCVNNICNAIKPGQIIYFGGSFKRETDKNKFIYLAVHLQYYYGISAYIPSGYEEKYLNLYSDIMFNPNKLLVEDRIKYIRNLPNVLMKLVDYGAYIFILDSKRSNITARYCEMDDINGSTIKAKTFNVFDMELIPLEDLYDLKDPLSCQVDHAELLKVLIEFEKKLKFSSKFIDITNVFFFQEEGKIQIAYVDSFSFESKCYAQPTVSTRPGFVTKINMEDLRVLYPLDIFMDGKPYINLVQKFLSARGNQKVTTAIHKHPYEYGEVLPFFSIYNSADLDLPFLDFTTIGLYHMHCSSVRAGLYEVLLEDMTVRGIRDNSQSISAFGGFHPLLDSKFIITEKFFTGGRVDV